MTAAVTATAATAVAHAVAEIRAGRPVVVAGPGGDDAGELVFAAAAATPALLAFVVRHTSGYLCAALPEADCDRLGLPPLGGPGAGRDRRDPGYAVTVDARTGVSTGISARDRARTIRLLAEPGASAADFVRPGHVVPLRAAGGGVLTRPGTAEAAVDLARLAGLVPAAALGALVSVRDSGALATGAELTEFAATHHLALLDIADLIAHRRRTEPHLSRGTETTIRTAHGPVRAIRYHWTLDESEHLALVAGPVDTPGDHGLQVPMARHTACLLGHVFSSLDCGCRQRLDTALAALAAVDRGVLLYLNSGPAGGPGCAAPIDPDLAEIITAQILHDLGVRTTRPLSGRPPLLHPVRAAMR